MYKIHRLQIEAKYQPANHLVNLTENWCFYQIDLILSNLPTTKRIEYLHLNLLYLYFYAKIS